MTYVNQPDATPEAPQPQQTSSGTLNDKYRLDRVIATVQDLLDDPSGSDFTLEYLMPKLNLAWDDLAAKLVALGLQYEEDVEVISLPAVTTDLSAYQGDGGALNGLLMPKKIEWKYPDEPDTCYRDVPIIGQVPDVRSETQGVIGAEFRKGVIYVSPSAVAVDLRVRFKTFTIDFADPSQEVVVGARNILAYSTVEKVCAPTARNNAKAMDWAAQKAREALDDFSELAIKLKQRQTLRFGRMSGRTRRFPRFIARVGS